jgi:hypothetical protein
MIKALREAVIGVAIAALCAYALARKSPAKLPL